MNRLLLFSTGLVLAAVAVLYLFAGQPKSAPTATRAAVAVEAPSAGDAAADVPSTENPRQRDALIAARSALTAPAFADGTWINSDALKVEDLRGRVVLVDFWTFGCYNCRNTLPALKRLDERYGGDRGLAIVGVHSPEFDHEKNVDNVRRQVGSLGIRYAVVTDNDYETWRAYGVEAWPTVFLLDKRGRIRWTHVGEGRYDEQERVVQKLLAEEYKN